MNAPKLIARGLTWPESPRWYDGAIYLSDCYGFRVCRIADGEMTTVAEVPGRPAGLGFFPDGRLLVAGALDRKLWWVETDGSLELALDLSEGTAGNLNDMIVDPQGRAWIGLTGFSLEAGEEEKPGTLYLWTPGEAPVVAASDIRFPNGLALTPDGGTLYLCETMAAQILAFDVGAAGALSNRRVHASLSNGPDGLCLDGDGALWVAVLFEREFQRISTSGAVVERIVMDALAVACVFGGPDRRTLFAAVSRHDFADPQSRPDGSLYAIERAEAGAGTP